MNERELWKSLIETWIRHREVELELLRRLERSLGEAAESADASTPAPGVEAVSPEDSPTPAPGVESVSPEDASTPAPGVQPVATSAEPEPEDPAWVAEVPLLLLGQADTWVGFPWDHVERVALSEEVELPQESEYRFSLGAILQVDREEEPYSLVWTQDGGPATLSCARIGGIVTIDGAVDRSIDSVIHPRSDGSDPRPVLLSLGDFIVELRSQRSAQTPAMAAPPAQADDSSSVESEFEDSEAPGQAETTSSGDIDSEGSASATAEDTDASTSIEASDETSDLVEASDPVQDEMDSIYDALPRQPEAARDPHASSVNAFSSTDAMDASVSAERVDDSGFPGTVGAAPPESADVSTSSVTASVPTETMNANAAPESSVSAPAETIEDPCDENELEADLVELHEEQRAPLDHAHETDSEEPSRTISPHDAEDGGARGNANGLVEHEAEEKILPSRLNGGRRSIPHALVAVHYLPARVAVVRMLRSAGWSVEEEAQPQNLFRRLQGQSPDVLFVEPTAPFSESTQERLHELVASGSRVVVLGSRLRPGQATPEGVLGRAPRLHFPFTEEESRELLGYLRVPDSDPRPTA